MNFGDVIDIKNELEDITDNQSPSIIITDEDVALRKKPKFFFNTEGSCKISAERSCENSTILNDIREANTLRSHVEFFHGFSGGKLKSDWNSGDLRKMLLLSNSLNGTGIDNVIVLNDEGPTEIKPGQLLDTGRSRAKSRSFSYSENSKQKKGSAGQLLDKIRSHSLDETKISSFIRKLSKKNSFSDLRAKVTCSGCKDQDILPEDPNFDISKSCDTVDKPNLRFHGRSFSQSHIEACADKSYPRKGSLTLANNIKKKKVIFFEKTSSCDDEVIVTGSVDHNTNQRRSSSNFPKFKNLFKNIRSKSVGDTDIISSPEIYRKDIENHRRSIKPDSATSYHRNSLSNIDETATTNQKYEEKPRKFNFLKQIFRRNSKERLRSGSLPDSTGYPIAQNGTLGDANNFSNDSPNFDRRRSQSPDLFGKSFIEDYFDDDCRKKERGNNLEFFSRQDRIRKRSDRNSLDSRKDHGFKNSTKKRTGSLDVNDTDDEMTSCGVKEKNVDNTDSDQLISYTVKSSDTLMSIAARFDSTPSELTKINKLSTRFLFPGQLLNVPDKGGTIEEYAKPESLDSKTQPKGLIHQTSFENREHIEENSGRKSRSESEDLEKSLDKECLEKFLKIQVRHITDGLGVVSGVLLVTPNAVMFDPNVSDPLVIERGSEKYGVIAPMDLVVNVALYYDIAMMKCTDSDLSKIDLSKVEIYLGPKNSLSCPEVPRKGLSCDLPDVPESPSSDETRTPDPLAVPSTNTSDLAERLEENLEIVQKSKESQEMIKKPTEVQGISAKKIPQISAEHFGGSATENGSSNPSLDLSSNDPSNKTTGVENQDNSNKTLENDDSPSKDTTLPELTANDDDSFCSCGGETRETSAFPKAFDRELLTPADGPARTQESLNRSHSCECDVKCKKDCLLTPKQPLAQSVSLPGYKQLTEEKSDKKRTTSVISGTSSESELPPHMHDDHKSDQPAQQQTRKQKVMKRISQPLSWIENIGAEGKEVLGGLMPHGPGAVPSNTSTGNFSEESPDSRSGVFGNVFNMSNVSNMLTSSPKYLADIGGGFFGRSPSSELSGSGSGSGREIDELFPTSSPRFPLKSPTGSSRFPKSPTGPLPKSSFYTSSLGRKHPVSFESYKSKSTSTAHPIFGRTSSDTSRRSSGHTSVASQRNLSSESPTSPFSDAKERSSKFGLKSMVSMEDMPDLFASFDSLIPKPAENFIDSPMYLCLRMGIPILKTIPSSTPIMTYGKKVMRPEYWFSIPRARVEEIYNFFVLRHENIYGLFDEAEILNRGYRAISEDIDLDFEVTKRSSTDLSLDDELKGITKESWESAPMSEELRRALNSSTSLTSLDIEAFLPEIIGNTEVVNDEIKKYMYRKLPVRVQGSNWQLIFSSATHGFSLKSLYRKMHGLETPIILFIEDTNKNIFGSFLSCCLHMSEHFYGTGESFLFVCAPEFAVYPWTGEDTFFVKGNNESLYIGGGDGSFGIWLDGDLYHGRSQSCKTFGNPPLSQTEDFIIKTIECWGFV